MKSPTTIRAFVWAEQLPPSTYEEMFPPKTRAADKRRSRPARTEARDARQKNAPAS